MSAPSVHGVHHLEVPVTDLGRARAWYERVLGLQVTREFPDDDGVVRGVAGDLAGPSGSAVVTLALRVDPDHARGEGGFDPISLAVGDPEDLGAWRRHLADQGGEAPPLSDGEPVRAVAVHDLDGVEIRLSATGAA